ncbi:DUF721 domain-containing protein [Paraoerskovia marina]|uniref:DUF721 domain-containing protein n=1 Tax=Paraoerskovia marina TaxID=545619 RepID=UPI0004929B4E|nr:DciA family protein [Paraoerskovia marina]
MSDPSVPAAPEGEDGDDVAPVADHRPLAERVDLTPPASVARAALDRARLQAKERGIRPGRRRPSPLADSATAERKGPGARDPQLFGDAITNLLRQRGWTADVTVGGVVGRWREIVGDDVANHCVAETFHDKVLVIRADSTAWATQMRILTPQVLNTIAKEVGDGVVTELTVLGPAGPSFKRGPRSVRGKGPRDTWG